MDLNRYSKQIKLQNIGIEGQKLLSTSKVIVVGSGGLGSIVLPFLVSAGVGKISILDFDNVDISNLNRQIFFKENQVGLSKVESIKKNLLELNSEIEIQIIEQRLSNENFELLKGYNLIIDCTDNFKTRYLINYCSLYYNIPFIMGGVEEWKGQSAIFNVESSASYSCIYPFENQDFKIGNCEDLGVTGPIVGMIGSFQANLALKYLLGIYESDVNRLYHFNFLDFSISTVKIKRNKERCAEILINGLEKESKDWLHKIDSAEIIIDVREKWEYEENPSHYINIPYDDALELEHQYFNGVQKVKFFCESGRRAKTVSNFLNSKLGLESTFIYS